MSWANESGQTWGEVVERLRRRGRRQRATPPFPALCLYKPFLSPLPPPPSVSQTHSTHLDKSRGRVGVCAAVVAVVAAVVAVRPQQGYARLAQACIQEAALHILHRSARVAARIAMQRLSIRRLSVGGRNVSQCVSAAHITMRCASQGNVLSALLLLGLHTLS